jgi:hypothetical protein
MNHVLARPARRREQHIQTIGVGPLVGIWNNLATSRLLTSRSVHHAPFNLRGIKGHFEGCYQFFYSFG